MENVRENKMGTAPVPSLLIKMALPMMVSMLMLAVYNIVDSIFVSRISENALTAVSLVYPFQMLFNSVAVGTAVGVNSLIARRLGEKRQQAADEAATTGQFLALVSGLVFMAAYGLFPRQLMSLFADDPEILDHATTYLRLCGGLCGFVFMAVMSEKILQATGSTVRSMMVQIVGAVFNIVFDPILIFGLCGFPKMGVAGAAIATVGGQVASMILGFVYMRRKDNLVSLKVKGFKPKAAVIGDIYKVGLPSIVMQAIGSVTTFALNKILYLFTPTAVSVLGVYFKLQSFVFMPVFGLNSGAMPIMGYNYGARNKARLMQALKCGVIYAFTIMIIGLAIFQIFPKQLLMMFDASEHMLEIGVPALRTISICFPFAAVGIMLGCLFQAVGQGVYSMFNSLCRQIFAIIPLAYLLAMTVGLKAVWAAFPLAEIVALTVCGILLRRTYIRFIKPLDAPKGSEA
ncbi:MAG: MATE family efflux transporter [Clostridia bacterium]|nr:MATE family efflux transporter [Clostridia bacterium]